MICVFRLGSSGVICKRRYLLLIIYNVKCYVRIMLIIYNVRIVSNNLYATRINNNILLSMLFRCSMCATLARAVYIYYSISYYNNMPI